MSNTELTFSAHGEGNVSNKVRGMLRSFKQLESGWKGYQKSVGAGVTSSIAGGGAAGGSGGTGSLAGYALGNQILNKLLVAKMSGAIGDTIDDFNRTIRRLAILTDQRKLYRSTQKFLSETANSISKDFSDFLVPLKKEITYPFRYLRTNVRKLGRSIFSQAEFLLPRGVGRALSAVRPITGFAAGFALTAAGIVVAALVFADERISKAVGSAISKVGGWIQTGISGIGKGLIAAKNTAVSMANWIKTGVQKATGVDLGVKYSVPFQEQIREDIQKGKKGANNQTQLAKDLVPGFEKLFGADTAEEVKKIVRDEINKSNEENYKAYKELELIYRRRTRN